MLRMSRPWGSLSSTTIAHRTLDALVAAVLNLVDESIWMRWLIFELKVERYRVVLAILK